MAKKKAIEDRLVTAVKTFGSEQNEIVVETVGNFGNMMYYRNKPRVRTIIKEEGTIEQIAIDFKFTEMPEFILVKSQTQKLILDGKEADLTDKNLEKFFAREPETFRNILQTILKNSGDMGFLVH